MKKAILPTMFVCYLFGSMALAQDKNAASKSPANLPRDEVVVQTYEIRDLAPLMYGLLPELLRTEGDIFQDLEKRDGVGLLARVLANWALLPDPENMQVVNGNALMIRATPSRHLAVQDSLAILRRMADLGVVMNARLYEVEKAFFLKEVAPLLVPEAGEKPPLAVTPSWALVRQIQKGNLVLAGADEIIRPGQDKPILSWQGVYSFLDFRKDVKPDHLFLGREDGPQDKQTGSMFATGETGVAFLVKPLASPRRSHLRLQLTQKTTELSGLNKVMKKDPNTGKEIMMESPIVQRQTLSGVVQTRDLDVLLIPVAFQPPGKKNADKKWVLLARPMIWIEEEVQRLRKEGKNITPRGVWDIEPEQGEELPPPATGENKDPSAPQFLLAWGKKGSKPGEFYSPIGIAINKKDEVYVADLNNSRVQKFSKDGQHLGGFDLPRDDPKRKSCQAGGILVDDQGQIYVTFMQQHKIAVYDDTGKLLREWGKKGAGDGEFNQPGGIIFTPDGNLLVTDQCNHRIQRCTREGKFLGKWGEHGKAPGQFDGIEPKGSRFGGPHFVALNSKGLIYTTEGVHGRVQQFTLEGKPLMVWGDKGQQPGGFGDYKTGFSKHGFGPIGVAVDRKDRVWVSSLNDRVQCYTPDGKYLFGITVSGDEPGQLHRPHGMAFDSQGNLYVADASNQRIQKFRVPE